MKNIKNKKLIMIISIIVGAIVIVLGTSYALYTLNVTKNSDFKVKVGKLELTITDTESEDRVVINDALPTPTTDALADTGYNFTITNTGTIDAAYTVYLDELTLENQGRAKMSNEYIKVNLSPQSSVNLNNTALLSSFTNGALTTGTLAAGQSVSYTLRVWIDYNADNGAQNKYFASRIRVDSTQEKALTD